MIERLPENFKHMFSGHVPPGTRAHYADASKLSVRKDLSKAHKKYVENPNSCHFPGKILNFDVEKALIKLEKTDSDYYKDVKKACKSLDSLVSSIDAVKGNKDKQRK